MDIVEIQAAYYMVAATGVLIAAVFYVLNIRATQKGAKTTLETRKADILSRHTQIYTTQDFMDSWYDIVFKQNYVTYEEWQKEYGPLVNPEAYTRHIALCIYHECLGGLLRENLVSIELILRMWQPLAVTLVWLRVEPVIKGWRETYQDDSAFENFEYLFNRILEHHPVAALTCKVRREQMIHEHDKKILSHEVK